MANVKPTKRSAAATEPTKAEATKKKTVAPSPRPAAPQVKKTSAAASDSVAGWLQDVSLEAPIPSDALHLKPGELELEFSVAMRKQGVAPQAVAELRARALVHARGSVLALAEASYMAPIAPGADEAALVQTMYHPLRQALQTILALAGHTPPLPESLDKAN